MSPTVLEAFLRPPQVVVLPAYTRLYKLTENNFKNTGAVSPWWAVVDNFRDDKEGLRKHVLAAALNGCTLKTYIRMASAISAEFNRLGKYQEIELLYTTRAL